MVSNSQLAIFAIVISAFIGGVIWKFSRDERKTQTSDQDIVCNLLRDKGHLLLSEIVVETQMSEERVKVTLAELVSKGVVCQRRVPGCKDVSDAMMPWALDLRSRRAG